MTEELFLNVKCKKTFKDCEYEIRAQVPIHKNCLQLSIRSPTEPYLWRSEFSAQYVEELTEKTGQKKSFFEFLGLIDSTLNEKGNKQQQYDVLTYSDLKNMNNQGTDATDKANQSFTTTNNRQNKRYLILTSGDTHYPLSLAGDIINDPNTLREIVKNLQEKLMGRRLNTTEEGQNSTFYSSNSFGAQNTTITSNKSCDKHPLSNQKKELEQVKMENDLLRAKVKRIEEYFTQKQGAVEIEQVIAQKFQLEGELDKVKQFKEKESLNLNLLFKRQEVLELQKQLTQTVCGGEEVAGKRLRAQLMQITEETESSIVLLKKTIQKQKTEIDRLRGEAEKNISEDKKLRGRIQLLEIELVNAQKRSNSRSNPLCSNLGNRSRSISSHSSINSRKSSPSNPNLPSRLGYSSPSLQLRSNRMTLPINKMNSPLNNNSKNSLSTPKSISSIRSNSIGTPGSTGTPSNRFNKNPMPQQNMQQIDRRSNKFFSNNNNSPTYQKNNSGTTPGQSQPGISLTIKNGLSQIDTIPEKGKYHVSKSPQNQRQPIPNRQYLSSNQRSNSNTRSQVQQPQSNIQQRNNSQSNNYTGNQASYQSSQNSRKSSVGPSPAAPVVKKAPQAQTLGVSYTQPRVISMNGYLKPKPATAVQPSKQGGLLEQSYQRTQLTGKMDQGLFDDSHFIKPGEQKSELEVRIDKLQNILQSAKDMAIVQDL